LSQRAAITFHELGDDFHEARALLGLGTAQLYIGKIADARHNLSRATTAYDKLDESSYAAEARALLAATVNVTEGTIPPHLGCPDDGDMGADVRRAWLNDLPHAVLRRADSRLDEARFVGNLMIGPTPNGSVLPGEVLAQNDLGLLVNGEDLTGDESLGFLRDHAEFDNDQGPREISAEIGNNPHALALAAALLRRERLTSTAFLQRLRKISIDGSPSFPSPPRRSGAARTALLAIESLERIDPRTGTLLDLIALLSAAPVDRQLIQRAFPSDDTAKIDVTLDALMDASALSSDDHDTIIMNPLVQEAARYRVSRRGTLLAVAAKATHLLLGEIAALEERPVEVAKVHRFARQIEALWAAVRPERPGNEWAATVDMMRLRAWQVNSFASAGQGAKTIELGGALLDDCQRILGANHRETWRARNNLAGAHSAVGDHDRACFLFAQNLRLVAGGADHPDTLLTRHNLAVTQLRAGRPKRAVRILEDVLADRERALRIDHPDTLETRHWLGVALGEIGDFAEATRLLEQTLHDRRDLAEPCSLGLVETLDALANQYAKSGRSDDAFTTRNESLTRKERIFPPGHIAVIAARRALADSNIEDGRFYEATQLLKMNLIEIERTYGPKEHITHAARQHLEEVQRKAKNKR
jgi:tetratricopeptide (TPR) repeat protein